jgi:hypothetical protein
MQEVKRTCNHSIRNILNEKYFKDVRKGSFFSKEVELKLDNYLLSHITFSSSPLNFGRLEVESLLIKKYEKQLLNSKSVRGIN